MKHLRNFFALAMIAVMVVGSFDASAKTKRTKSGKSKAKTSKTTKSRKNSNQLDYDLEFFQNVVSLANTQCPMYLDEGLVVNSITMEGTGMYYNSTVSDNEMIEVMRQSPELFTSLMKSKSILSEMCEAYDDEMIDTMIKLGITVNFRFYAEGSNRPILNVPITAKELKQAKY